MSPRSFWIVLLKSVGVWILFSGVSVIPMFFSTFYPMYAHFFENWQILLLSLVTVLIYVWVIHILVFKPHLVIDKLKLDQHFDEEQFSFNIHRSIAVAIAIIIIGGLMIINTVPGFFRVLFLVYKWKTESQTVDAGIFTGLFTDLCKILIGYLLVVNNRAVVNFIEKTRRTPAPPAEDYNQATEETTQDEN